MSPFHYLFIYLFIAKLLGIVSISLSNIVHVKYLIYTQPAKCTACNLIYNCCLIAVDVKLFLILILIYL